MIIFFLVLAVVLGSVGWFVAIRSLRLLISQDMDWGEVVQLLAEYGFELERLTSGDILTDHPEVLKFHRLNRAVLARINEVVESSHRRRAEEKKPKEQLPRPDVE